ncbi:iron-siderophore ABC transporter substrate-binding protein [Tritonibacter horizontis]|uniref:Putative siderophore-binding lipoprotein YfiY n=1 Tax=Tritonibacter horizontis TaxID=1768241 RepID=A0A132C1V8_9RHOB|nr:iron-siderophore ABC transporter substrate-binding protein [Tritonibacter horizontis]KUP94553.1 putative siderophore-binding lipoprotein YfiY precursor [Tritonibacter horizontis]
MFLLHLPLRLCHIAVGYVLWLGLVLAGQGAVAQSFPLTIDHAFGATTIMARPERVATVAWANHEVPLALGIVPVGMARANFGDDDGDGLLPWVSQRLAELDAKPPVLFDEGDGIDFEAVAETRPDVILAAYSGLTQADYEMLSRIAPVVPYRRAPWATDWREMITLNGTALGLASETSALIAEIEAQIADTMARYPELVGKTAMFVTHLDIRDLSMIRFYTAHDTRVKFFADLGLATPQSVVEAGTDGSYSGQISAERIDELADVDILVSYGGAALLDRIRKNLLTAHMKSIRNDAVVLLSNDPLGTAANPTPLSIPYVLESYVALLADAARKTQ